LANSWDYLFFGELENKVAYNIKIP
jgi:hypothetical protein